MTPSAQTHSAKSHARSLQAWGIYCMRASHLFWSSGEVIARRGLLYAFPESANVLDPDFDRMVSEKSVAATEMWTAMIAKSTQLGPALGWKIWSNMFMPNSAGYADMGTQATQGAIGNANAALSVMKAGMRPVQKRVTANAKRLKSRKK